MPIIELDATPSSGTGQFTVTFLNNGGQFPTLSHLILAGTFDGAPDPTCTECAPPPAVPEPATLAVLGTGMLALAIVRRRRGGSA
jgi:hypothetical protein